MNLKSTGEMRDSPTEQLSEAELLHLLSLEDFSPVYQTADQIRRQHKGDQIQIRAILEFSNHCRRSCRYCGLRCENQKLPRYRMEISEIVEIAKKTADAGYRTLVLQSGEDPWYHAERICEIVFEVKKTGMAVTLSCGERPDEEYALFRQVGADRYLIKHETADPKIYSSLHPCGTLDSRVHCLETLKSLGYETGSGFMIGLPNQTQKTIVQDLLLLSRIGCEMAGIGPFIPHPDTPLKEYSAGSTERVKRSTALARILLPDCNLPATTALGVLSNQEKLGIFSCGANVIMRKVTPDDRKRLYEIYPANLGHTSIRKDRAALEEEIRALNRIPF